MERALLATLLGAVAAPCAGQSVGYFNYGQPGKTTWANHIMLNANADLVMAGVYSSFTGSKSSMVIANSAGTYVTNRSMSAAGEMFSAVIDATNSIYAGGFQGVIGSTSKYIVKYTPGMAQAFARTYGPGSIRYVIHDGGSIAAVGFNRKPSVLRVDAAGGTIWHKEYTVSGGNGDGYMIVKAGPSYYIVGNLWESAPARAFLLCVDAATGAVNWCRTYVGAASPHFTGMALSASGLIMCGTTGLGGGGNLLVVKTDFAGNVQWTRQVNNAYSWYQNDPNVYYTWGVNCAVDGFGAVIVAYEDNPSYGLLAKLNEATGSLMWVRRYGNSGDGFHGITVSGCTYLATGWFGPAVGTTWDYGLVVCDTSGYAGGGGTCGTAVARANSAPVITSAAVSVTSADLTANAIFSAATNTTEGFSRAAVCSGISPTCTTPLPVELLSFTGSADCSQGATDLRWVTASERDSHHFTVERSADGSAWEAVEQVPAMGDAHGMQEYRATDAEAPAGTRYYRLRQTDRDGSWRYVGEVIALARDCPSAAMRLAVFPNPATGVLGFRCGAAAEGAMAVEVRDAVGRLVLDEERAGAGSGPYSLDISALADGAYSLTVRAGSGAAHAKFIKQ